MLLDQHATLIKASAIAPEVAAERGYYSATTKAELERLKFGRDQRRVPALVVPVFGVDGRVVGHQVRPDYPRENGRGKPVKYETPAGWRMRLDVHPRSRRLIGDPKVPAVVTEGVRKGDAGVSKGLCMIALLGVWNWRGRNGDGGRVALPDWEDVALDGRAVYIAFDSDAMERPEVFAALDRLGPWLTDTRGAHVRFIYLPRLDGGVKCGVDDFFAAGHSVDDLFALATEAPRQPPKAKPKPAPPAYDGPPPTTAEVLNAGRHFVARYVVMTGHQRVAVALWTAHTHAFTAAGSTPYLDVNSPEPESGKTLLLEVLETVVARPWLTARTTAAALIRKVDAERPTLLLDESDATFNGAPEYAEALRGVLNSGYRASGRATVCVGQGADLKAHDFATFCPKAIGGLGKLPDTVRSRSIPVRLQRRRDDEPVAVWLSSTPPPDAAFLRDALAAWASANTETLAKASPERPDGIGDRAYDVWRPLLAIAEAAGEPWTTDARNAAVALNGKKAGDVVDDSHGIAVLAKLRALFADSDTVASAAVVDALNADEELPFGGWHKGDGVKARDVAKLLKPYGIRPKGVRVGDATPRGYQSDQCTDAFSRYLASPSATTATTTPQSQKTANSYPQQMALVADSEEAANPHGTRDVADVADGNAEIGAEGDDTPQREADA